MYKDWSKIAADLTALTKQLRVGVPEPMKAFADLARSSIADGALDKKTKELIAVGISVATRCDPCIAFHVEAARKAGASREEVMETVATAIYMGAGPSAMYAAQALEAFDQFTAKNTSAAA